MVEGSQRTQSYEEIGRLTIAGFNYYSIGDDIDTKSKYLPTLRIQEVVLA